MHKQVIKFTHNFLTKRRELFEDIKTRKFTILATLNNFYNLVT
jgi:hypothetical protein